VTLGVARPAGAAEVLPDVRMPVVATRARREWCACGVDILIAAGQSITDVVAAHVRAEPHAGWSMANRVGV